MKEGRSKHKKGIWANPLIISCWKGGFTNNLSYCSWKRSHLGIIGGKVVGTCLLNGFLILAVAGVACVECHVELVGYFLTLFQSCIQTLCRYPVEFLQVVLILRYETPYIQPNQCEMMIEWKCNIAITGWRCIVDNRPGGWCKKQQFTQAQSRCKKQQFTRAQKQFLKIDPKPM